jgi:hypothetical protein
MKLQIPQLQTQKSSRNLSQKEKKDLAIKRWKVIKLHVFQGTFHVATNVLNPLEQVIEGLWKDISDHCEDIDDSTVEFLQSKGMSLPMGPQQRRNQRRAGVVELAYSKQESSTYQDVKRVKQRQVLQRRWGLDDRSLDRVPHCNVNYHLFIISYGLAEFCEKDCLISTTKQINLNRGWKILLIGLCQAEAFARYETLAYLQQSLPSINKTLQDSKTRSEIGKRILEIVKGDERKENRTRGLFVLGEWISQMGNSIDMHPLLKEIVLVLVRDLADLILHDKLSVSTKPPQDETAKVHLLKTIQNAMQFTIQGCEIDSVMMYLIHLEMGSIIQTFPDGVGEEVKSPRVSLFVLLGILDLLVSLNFDQHEHYLGALFHPFITTCQMIGYKPITKKVLEFVCKFLPISKEDNLKKGMEVVMNGIRALKQIYAGEMETTIDDQVWSKELIEWQKKHHEEQIRISLHEVLIRRIMQPPGSVSKLYPISGCHGFFGEMETGMRKTESILVDFPVHAKSYLGITRVVGQIPGVPAWATTSPPLFFMSQNNLSGEIPVSKYEYQERIGSIPGLPCGYTYSPGTLTNQRSSFVTIGKPTPTGGSWTDIYRVVKLDEWEEKDNIPSYATRFPMPPKPMEEGTCPYGFLLVCPYPGFDPEKVGKNGTSSLYGRTVRNILGDGVSKNTNTNSTISGAMGSGVTGKDRMHYQDYSNLCLLDDGKKTFIVPENHTINRHPVLFPCKLPGLKLTESDHEFLPRSPVVFDIIQPHQPVLRRILCVVERIDGESSNIVVQKGAGDIGGLYDGASFNMYIKVRSTQKWHTVQLKVLDENYHDGLDFSSASVGNVNSLQANNTMVSSTFNKRHSFVTPANDMFSTPIPVNYTAQGEPYFSPPVNLPPLPVGYNQYHLPYFGKTPSLKPHPLGISVLGNKYYEPAAQKITASDMHKHQLAGFDADGYPFFVPKGASLPIPSGFTIDGLPFYDISALIRTQGVFALTPLLRGDDKEPNELEHWVDLGRLLQNPYSGSTLELKRLETYFVTNLIKNVEQTQPLLKRKLNQSRTRLLNPFTRGTGKQGFTPPDNIIQEPIEISEFLRNGLAYAQLRSHFIRIVLEPAQSDFYSAKAPITKVFVLRFKAGRGDHNEREYFLAVEPANVFSIQEFNLKLQGEGFHEIAVTFYPLAMKSPQIEGSLHVFDRYGRKMAHSKLVAIRKHFFKVHSDNIDFGWLPLHKKKESVIALENLTEFPVSIAVNISKDSVFVIPNSIVKLRAMEIVRMPVYFAPKYSGTFLETVRLIGPGGEESPVTLQGTSETPVSVLAEDEHNSRLGITFLSMERSSMVKKWAKGAEDIRIVTGVEMQLIDKIHKSASDPEIKKELLTMDFGVCCLQDKPVTRCLTIFNWDNESITVGLFPHDRTISCPYLIRVAGCSASTVEVTFNFNSPKQPNRGNYTSVIELSCHGVENILIDVQAYIGQPVYFPLYEYAFFKPCRIGQTSQIATHLINESQYQITCHLEGLDDRIYLLQKSSIINIAPFGLAPLTLVYRPDVFGPIFNNIRIQIVKPTQRLLSGSLRDKNLIFVGVCIQPRKLTAENPIHPATEKLLKWISNSRGPITEWKTDEFLLDDMTDVINVTPEEQSDVIFKADPFITEIMGDFSNASNLMVQNRSKSTKKIRFFASPGFLLEPKEKHLEAGELIRVDHSFNPPPQVGNLVMVYGFACLLDLFDYKIHSTQIIKRLSLGFMLLPAQNYTDQNMVFDFGRIELANEGSAECTRYLMLCNPFQFRYNWSIKIAPSARKNMGFEIVVMKGELSKYDTCCVPFKFKIDISGFYETKCDIFIDPIDQISKSVRLGTIVLRGIAVHTKLLGLPETIDFGSTIVYHTSKKRINLQNEGSSELDIVVLVRTPYSVQPNMFAIPAKSNQWIEISFNPTEHKISESLIQVFANQKLYGVYAIGTGGAAQLVCEQYSQNPVDFGLQKDGSIVWTDLYLTNKGSIPLKAIAVMSDQPLRVRVEFNGVLNESPGEDQSKFFVRKDYWGLIRRKIKALPYLTQFTKYLSIKRAISTAYTKQYNSLRQIVPVYDVLECDALQAGLKLPHLYPSASYHFRIGFPVSESEEMTREVIFSYVPLCEATDQSELQNLIENTSVELTGNVYVPLQIRASHLHFGLVPAEVHLARTNVKSVGKKYGATRQSSETTTVRNVKIFNRAKHPQIIQLDRISPEFTIAGRIWTIKSEELAEIPIEFHPPREQTQYLGEVVFSHKYGILRVKLEGTGASADLIFDDVIDFGNLKLNCVATRTFSIYNRGILSCQCEMDIIQTEDDFWFKERDPYEFEAEVPFGGSISKEICCRSNRKGGSTGHISVKWRRVPNGQLENYNIPLKLLIGYPEFRIVNPELDFKATFIGINKTLPIQIKNEGNASCNWQAIPQISSLTIDISCGVLEPGDLVVLLVTYTPKEFGVLDGGISFITDSGIVNLVCFGLVGVPYLKIDNKARNTNFGVVSVGRSHELFIDVINTGNECQEFEVKWLSMSRDSEPCATEDLEFYFVEPAHSVIKPGEHCSLKVVVFAKDYAVCYKATFCIFTIIGEQHLINLSAIGGQAIINIQPPRLVKSGDSRNIATPKYEKRNIARKLGAGAIPIKEMEATKVLMKSHIDNLYSVVAGLRAAEDELKHTKDPSLSLTRNSGGAVQDSANPRPYTIQHNVLKETARLESTAFLESILKIENDLEDAIAKLDPTGILSAENVIASSQNYRSQTAPSAQSSTPSSSKSSSRSFGQYRPGRRLIRRSQEVGTAPISSEKHLNGDGSSGSSVKPLTGVVSSQSSSMVTPLGEIEIFDGHIALGPDPNANWSRPSSNIGRGIDLMEKDSILGKPGAVLNTRTTIESLENTDIMNIAQQALEIGNKLDEEENTFKPSFEKKVDHNLVHPNVAKRMELPVVSVDYGSKVTVTEVHESQKEFQALLSFAQKLGISIEVAKENIESLTQVNHMINSCMSNTRSAIKTAKGTLLEELWIPNREVIQLALKKLQISTKAIESILNGKLQETNPEESIQSTVYSLGLICGGDRSLSTLLFCIPNDGNISFSFSIEPIKNDRYVPAESSNMNIEFFSLENGTGLLMPGDFIEISASFIGFATGTYRQGFALKSGDDEIMTFTLLGVVGNPILHPTADSIDFGLIGKGQSASKQFLLKNTGSFTGNWDMKVITAEDHEKCFNVSPMSGKTGIQEESVATVTFAPIKEGPYFAELEITWRYGPTRVSLSGIGGGSKLEFHFESHQEQVLNGIDFGATLVGLEYEKFVSLKNVGTLGTIVEFSHPNRSLIFQADRNEFGEIRLEPGQTSRVKITYRPDKIERLKDMITFTLGKPKTGVQSIAVKGKSQTQSWVVEGALDFMNLKVGEFQEKSLIIKNTGTSSIPLEIKFEPSSLEKYFEISYDNWIVNSLIEAGKTHTFRFLTSSKLQELVEGSIILKSVILNQIQENRFDIFFRFFTEDILTALTDDIDLGRAAPGEQLHATQTISNHGNKTIHYRARLEMPDSGSTDWKIDGSTEYGSLEPNESIEINAIFDAISGRGDGWQQARLVVERTNANDEDWTGVSDVRLKAALGIAQFILEPATIDFGEVGVGTTKNCQIWIKNPGTAVCLYQITNSIPNDIILLDFPLNGTIAPDSQTPICIQFSPQATADFICDIDFKTSVGDLSLSIFGKSLELAIHFQSLPKFLDFEKLFLNQLKSIELDIENDCGLDLDLDISIINDLTKQASSAVRIQPSSSIMIPRNSKGSARNLCSLELQCGILISTDSFGCVTPGSFESFPFSQRQIEILNISNRWKTFEYRIPIYYKIDIAALSFFRSIETKSTVERIDFGAVNLDTGAIKKYFICNTNPFKLRGTLVNDCDGSSVFLVYVAIYGIPRQ